MTNLLKVFTFSADSISAKKDKIYVEPSNEVVSLVTSKQVEHSSALGEALAVLNDENLVTVSSGPFKGSDRLKFIQISSASALNLGTYKIKTYVSATQVRVTPPVFTDEVDVAWELRSFEKTYPLDTDLQVATRVWNPASMKALSGFSAVSSIPTDTSIGFRLNDGTDTFYWDGGAWATPTLVTHWNVEADVNTNIASFDVSATKLKVFCKLATTDSDETPTLTAIKIRYAATLSYHFDFYDSLIKYLQELSAVDFVQDNLTAISSVTLSEWTSEQQYQITGVSAVYNLDVDPTTDILSSYAGGVVTFTASQTGNVRIYFTYTPYVRFWPHQDYVDIDTDLVPTVAIDNMDEVARVKLGGSTGWGHSGNYAYPTPAQASVEIRLNLMAKRMRTLAFLADAVEKKILTDSKISLLGIDENMSVRATGGFEERTKSNFSDLKEGTITMLVYFHPRYYEDASLTYRVLQTNLNI